MRTDKKYLILFLILNGLSPSTFAWGERGHHALCEAAASLVQEEELQLFFKSKSEALGHLCNIPDIHWRSIETKESEEANPTHYLNPETLGFTLESLPSDFKAIQKKLNLNGKDLNEKLGSLWWRADQFFRLAIQESQKASSAKSPRSKNEKQNDEFPYNQAVYQMIVFMGLLGHFVGDASMPYHNMADFDGWEKGRGGIHSYYETSIVNDLNLDLPYKIFLKAKQIRKNKSRKNSEAKSVIERMRSLSISARDDLAKVEALDKVFRKSKTPINKYGEEFRLPAKRNPAHEMAPKFEDLIVDELARSAVLLAELWDEIYVKGGKPKLRGYRNYRYPLNPDLISPDYY